LLRQLGFEYFEDRWCKELPQEIINDIVIDTSVDETPQEQSMQISPAKELSLYLMQKGIPKDRLGEFVKNVLSISSKDNEGIKTALADKHALDEMVQIFLAEPAIEEVY